MRKRVLPLIALFVLLLGLLLTGCDDAVAPIDRIAFTTLPKLNYLKGETLQIGDAKLCVYYSNGETETVPLKLEMVSDYDVQEVGDHVLTVKYENVYTNIKITVTNAPVNYIEVVGGEIPYKVNYIEEQSLDVDNVFLQIHYDSGNPDTIPVTESMVSGFDSKKIGVQHLTVSYIDPITLRNYTTTYDVTVRARTVSHISIGTVPDKNLYLIDEKITIESLAGGVLFIAYDNGFSERIDFDKLYETQEQYDENLVYSTKLEKKREIVTLNYGGKSVIFDIQVLVKDAEEFTIVSLPTDYQPQITGTDLSLAGGRLRVKYNNKTTEVFDMTVSKVISAIGYDRTKIGVQQITLGFNDIATTFTFEIEVVDTKPLDLEILTPVVENGEVKKYSEAVGGDSFVFYQDSVVDLSLWEFRLAMDNGTYSAIHPVAESMLVGGSSQLRLDTVGAKTLSFTYTVSGKQFVKDVTVVVARKMVSRITVTQPTERVYFLNGQLVLDGANYTAYFNDGTEKTGAVTSSMVSGYISSKLGSQTVTVKYVSPEGYGQGVATFTVLVVKRPSRIAYDTACSVRTAYILGEEFSTANLVMNVYYEGMATPDSVGEPFTEEWSFENTSFDTLGNRDVIAVYEAYGARFTCNIPVFVRNDLLSIELLFDNGFEEYEHKTSFPDVVSGIDINLNGYCLRCTYENGEKIVPVTKAMLDYNRADKTSGIRNVTLTYGTKKLTALTVNVEERDVSGIVIDTAPDKSYYLANRGEELVIDGLVIRINYTNNTFRNVSDRDLVFLRYNSATGCNEYDYTYYEDDTFTPFSLVFSFDALDDALDALIARETHTINVRLSTHATSFDVVVTHKLATGITWNVAPDGDTPTLQSPIVGYQGMAGDEFIKYDVNGTKFKVIYNDGDSYEIFKLADVWSSIEIQNFDRNVSGNQTVNFCFEDVVLKTVIDVEPKTLLSVAKSVDFEIPAVIEGLDLNLVNAKLDVRYYHYIDGEYFYTSSEIPVSKEMVTNFNSRVTPISVYPLNIQYTFNGVTRTVIHDIEVLEKSVTSIDIYTMPKSFYIELETFSSDGGSIIVYYDNNTNRVISMDTAAKVTSEGQISGDDFFILNYQYFNSEDFSGEARRQEIILSYYFINSSGQKNEIPFTTTYDVTVHDRLYITVEFDEVPEYDAVTGKYTYLYGEDHDIGYTLMGYEAYTDIEENLRPISLSSFVVGTDYLFKFVNDETKEEYDTWPKDVGTYTIVITYNAERDSVHNNLAFSGRKLVITPRLLRFTVKSVSSVYGETAEPYSATVQFVKYIETVTGEILETLDAVNVFGYNDDMSNLGAMTFTCNDSDGIPVNARTRVGSYIIGLSFEGNSNYTLTYIRGQHSITQRPVTVIAYPQEKIYGELDPVFTYTTSGVLGNDKSGLIEGDSFNDNLTRVVPSSNKNVGSYEIVLGNLSNPNYAITFVKNYLTIKKRNLSIYANNATKIYGEPIQRFTASVGAGTGMVYGESLTTLSGTLSFVIDVSGTRTPVGLFDHTIGVGTYVVYPQGLTSDNYNITFFSGTFSVTRRPVAVIPDSRTSIYGTYCNKDTGAYSISIAYTTSNVGSGIGGLIGLETLSGSLTRSGYTVVDGKPVYSANAGEYDILQGTITNENNPNYDIVFTEGVKEYITKRTAKIYFPDAEKLKKQYDGLQPSLGENDYSLAFYDNFATELINPFGTDIKSSISFVFPNASSAVRTYAVNFRSTDVNHNISFVEQTNSYVIVPKPVTTEFFNIPYGAMVNGLFGGVTYDNTTRYFGAKVRPEDIVGDDSVSVVIALAKNTGGELVFRNANSVKDAGNYVVRVTGLDDPNYVIRVPSDTESDFRETVFKVNPALIKVEVTTKQLQYTGNELTFSSRLALKSGYYTGADYRVVSVLYESPSQIGLEVYPYEINSEGIERSPVSVKYVTEGDDEYVGGYDIRALVQSTNYYVRLVKNTGTEQSPVYVEIERNENGVIADVADMFKVIQRVVTVNIPTNAARKYYDGNAPSFPEGTVSSNASIDIAIDFQRVMTDFEDGGKYAYMKDYLSPADAGTFKIVPYSTDRNYKLQLSALSATTYVINRKAITSFVLPNTDHPIKQYDGLMPSFTSSDFTLAGYDGAYIARERSHLRWTLDFGEETAFEVGEYGFSIEFRFPYVEGHEEVAQARPALVEGCANLDFNHYFRADVTPTLSAKTYTIAQRTVKILAMQYAENAEEGYSWKYYNGLPASTVITDYEANGAMKTTASPLANAFIVIDAAVYSETNTNTFLTENISSMRFGNGDQYMGMHMLNEDTDSATLTQIFLNYGANLYLEMGDSAVSKGNYDIAFSDANNAFLKKNFLVSLDTTSAYGNYKITQAAREANSFVYRILERQLHFYVDHTELTYGDSRPYVEGSATGKAMWELRISPDDVKYLSQSSANGHNYFTVYNGGLGAHSLFASSTGYFSLNNITIAAYPNGSHTAIGARTSAGTYNAVCSVGVSYGNFSLVFDEAASVGNVSVIKRELPVRSTLAAMYNGCTVVARVYGTSNVLFNYDTASGLGSSTVGLTSWDNALPASAGFSTPGYSLNAVAGALNTDVGIVTDSDGIVLDENLGDNANYFFTYENFSGDRVYLNITEARIVAGVANMSNEKLIRTTYGTLPQYNVDYKYTYSGIASVAGDTITNLLLPQNGTFTEEVVNGVTFVGGNYWDVAKVSLDAIMSINLDLEVAWSGNNVSTHSVAPSWLSADTYTVAIQRKTADGTYADYGNITVNKSDINLKNYILATETSSYRVAQKDMDVWLRSLYDYYAEGTDGEGTELLLNLFSDETLIEWEDIADEWLVLYYYAQNHTFTDTSLTTLEEKALSEELMRYIIKDLLNTASLSVVTGALGGAQGYAVRYFNGLTDAEKYLMFSLGLTKNTIYVLGTKTFAEIASTYKTVNSIEENESTAGWSDADFVNSWLGCRYNGAGAAVAYGDVYDFAKWNSVYNSFYPSLDIDTAYDNMNKNALSAVLPMLNRYANEGARPDSYYLQSVETRISTFVFGDSATGRPALRSVATDDRLYEQLSAEEVATAFDVIYFNSSTNVAALTAAPAAAGFTMTEEKKQTIVTQLLPPELRRSVFEYVFHTDGLKGSDVLWRSTSGNNISLVYDAAHPQGYRAVKPTSSVDVSTLANTLNARIQEAKAISPSGVSSIRKNYTFKWISSSYNTYNYIVRIGIGDENNTVPNIMLDEDGNIDFIIRVEYNNGEIGYVKYSELIDSDSHYLSLTKLSGNIDLGSIGTNQSIVLKLVERFFVQADGSYEKTAEITSSPFNVRVYRNGDSLLFNAISEAKSIIQSSGERFVNAASNVVFAGSAITNNNVYRAANADGSRKLLNYDYLDASFTLKLKTGSSLARAFRLYLNTVNEGIFYIEFSSSDASGFNIVFKKDDGTTATIREIKPSALDFFDGSMHNVKVYLDKMGGASYDSTVGSRLVFVFDNEYYIVSNIGTDISLDTMMNPGFASVDNTVAYINKFKASTLGIASVHALELMPYTTIDSDKNITYNLRSASIGTARSKKFTVSELLNLIAPTEHFRSSFNFNAYDPDTSGTLRALNRADIELVLFSGSALPGNIVDGDITLTPGTYLFTVQAMLNGTVIATTEVTFCVSRNYQKMNWEGVEKCSPSNPVEILPTGGLTRTLTLQSSSAVSFERLSYAFTLNMLYDEQASSTEGLGTVNEYPYNIALLFATTGGSKDLRSTSEGNTFGGVGLYILNTGSGYQTYLFLRNIGSAPERYDIDVDWSNGMAHGTTGMIEIEFIVDKANQRIRLVMNVNGTVYTRSFNEISALVNATSNMSTKMIVSPQSTVKFYNLEHGARQYGQYNYINDQYVKTLANEVPARDPNNSTLSIIGNTGETVFGANSNVFISANKMTLAETLGEANGECTLHSYNAYRTQFNNYEISFSAARSPSDYTKTDDELSFWLSANGTFDDVSNGHYRGIKIGYNADNDINVPAGLYLQFYKANYAYRAQLLSQSLNLIDGADHTIRIEIATNNGVRLHTPNVTEPTNALEGYLGTTAEYMTINVYADGVLVGSGYVPYMNDIANWNIHDAMFFSVDDYSYENAEYDRMFLPEVLYAGFKSDNSVLTVKDVKLY